MRAGDKEDEGEEDDDHDPHFEPIVPLPKLVETKTGEEEEEAQGEQNSGLITHSVLLDLKLYFFVLSF